MRRRLLGGGLLATLCAPAAAALPAVLRSPALGTALGPAAVLLAAARVGQRLVVAGERGIVLISDDQGRRWTQARVPVQVSLTALAFADDRNGWAAGHFGVLLRTADAGATWTLALDGLRAAELVLQAAGVADQKQRAQRLVDEGPDKPWFDLHVHDGQLFAVGAYGLALQGRDGAALQSFSARLPNPRQLHLHGVRRVGDHVVIVGEQGLLLRSGNRGASFDLVPPPYKGSFFGVLASRSGSLLAYGLRGSLFRSDDAGSTWNQVANPLPVGLSAGIQRADGSLVLAAQNGDLLASRDDGRTFQHQRADTPQPAAALAEAEAGWLVVAGPRGVRRQALA